MHAWESWEKICWFCASLIKYLCIFSPGPGKIFSLAPVDHNLQVWTNELDVNYWTRCVSCVGASRTCYLSVIDVRTFMFIGCTGCFTWWRSVREVYPTPQLLGTLFRLISFAACSCMWRGLSRTSGDETVVTGVISVKFSTQMESG